MYNNYYKITQLYKYGSGYIHGLDSKIQSTQQLSISTTTIIVTRCTVFSCYVTLHVPCSVQSLLSRNDFIHHISLPLCSTSTGYSGWLLGGSRRWNFIQPFTHWGAPRRADQLILISSLLPPSLTSLFRHLVGCVSAGCNGNVSGWGQRTTSRERELNNINLKVKGQNVQLNSLFSFPDKQFSTMTLQNKCYNSKY